MTLCEQEIIVENIDEQEIGIEDFNVVAVPLPIKLQEKTATENGIVRADSGYAGLSKVNVNVDTESYYEQGQKDGLDKFFKDELTEIVVPSGATLNDDQFAKKTNLKKVVLPEGITSIPSGCFRLSSVSNVNIPKSLTTINSSAFYNCQNLKSITFNDTNNLSLGLEAFRYARVENFVFPKKVTFTSVRGCSYNGYLKTVEFKEDAVFNAQEFEACARLEKVIFGGQVNKIDRSFYNCLKVILYDFSNCLTIPPLSNISSLGHASGCQIVVPDTLYDEWVIATNWVNLTNVVFVKASEYVGE